jgi:PAS domain S-box-containing protein
MLNGLYNNSPYVLNLLAVQTTLVALGISLLGTYALVREQGSQVSVAYFIQTLSMGVWLFAFSRMYSANDVNLAMWWAKVAFIGIGCLPAAVYNFCALVLQDYKRLRKRVLTVWMTSALFITLILTTDIQFKSLYHYWWGYFPKFGITSIPFILYFFTVLIIAFRSYVAGYRNVVRDSIELRRARILMIAFAIGSYGVVDFLGAFGIPWYPLGYVAIFLLTIISGYSTVRYRFMPITAAFASHQIIDTMKDALFVIDPDGIIRLVNHATCVLFKCREQDLVGKRPTSSLCINTTFAETLESAIRNGTIRSLEVGYQDQENSRLTLSLTITTMPNPLGEPLATVCIMSDITKRKHVEQALEQEKVFSDMVIDSLPGVFYICDEQGRLVRWNDNEKAVTGYSSEEIAQMTVLRLFQGDRELLATHLREVLETGKATVEASLVSRSGLSIPYYLTGSRMVINDQRYIIGAGIEISERKRLEQQLLHAQKMESVGQLAGGIAHDFNNILAAIVGYGNILQMKMQQDDPLRGYLNQILASADRAASLTQSLLAFSRKQVISPREIDLNESILRFEKFLVRTIGEDIVLSTSLSDEVLTIFVDPMQIEQVMMNLATNTRDAMPKGGRLMIETGRAMLDDEYVRTHGFGFPGQYAVLTVSDTGEGMDEQTQHKIFEPFFTTKEVGRGTGLGLAIVYGIVKQNKGYINVYSELGKGTTFKIYFPFVIARAGKERHLDVQQPLCGGTETILFAEDNETIRLLNRSVLQEFGYTVIEASDGEEALQKFQEHRDRISILILDVIMPKKSGREVLEEVRQVNPKVKVIFTSGYPADLVQKEGVLEKGLHFLSKPSSPQALLRTIREVLDLE